MFWSSSSRVLGLLLLLVACLLSLGDRVHAISPGEDNVCTRDETYEDNMTVTQIKPYEIHYYVYCFSFPPRCSRVKTGYRTETSVETAIKTRTVTECCKGFMLYEDECVPKCAFGPPSESTTSATPSPAPVPPACSGCEGRGECKCVTTESNDPPTPEPIMNEPGPIESDDLIEETTLRASTTSRSTGPSTTLRSDLTTAPLTTTTMTSDTTTMTSDTTTMTSDTTTMTSEPSTTVTSNHISNHLLTAMMVNDTLIIKFILSSPKDDPEVKSEVKVKNDQIEKSNQVIKNRFLTAMMVNDTLVINLATP